MLKHLQRWRRRMPSFAPYDPRATQADIVACFRLLLGRTPHAEEWSGHIDRVGQDLPGVVSAYVNSLEFARRGLLQPAESADVAAATLEGFQLFAALDDAAVGRHVRGGVYEPEVTAVFRRLLRPGMGVVDLGANIGYFTMLSASLVGADGLVVAVEPNPRNVRLLERSRRANGFEQVRVCQVAAGREPGLLMLNTSHSNGTTSVLPGGEAIPPAAEIVPAMPADSLVPDGRRIHLVKLDVEGAEHTALLGATRLLERDRPHLVSEFSPTLMPGISGVSGAEYLDWIRARGYAIGTVGKDGTVPAADQDNDAIMAEYHRRGTDHLDLLAAPAAR